MFSFVVPVILRVRVMCDPQELEALWTNEPSSCAYAGGETGRNGSRSRNLSSVILRVCVRDQVDDVLFRIIDYRRHLARTREMQPRRECMAPVILCVRVRCNPASRRRITICATVILRMRERYEGSGYFGTLHVSSAVILRVRERYEVFQESHAVIHACGCSSTVILTFAISPAYAQVTVSQRSLLPRLLGFA